MRWFVPNCGYLVGHTQFVTSQLLYVRFQQEKVRLVGLGFNRIDPFVIWISQS